MVLGFLGRSRRRSTGIFAVFLLEFLDDFIQQIVEEFVGILVLGIAEEFVFSAELCDERGGSDGTVVDRAMGNVQEKIAKCGEEGGGVRGDRGS